MSSNPCRGADAAVSRTGSHWQPVLLDLVELDEAGALAGILEIIRERLARVRNGLEYEDPAGMAAVTISYVPVSSAPGSPRHRQMLAEAGAQLAYGIDRIAGMP